MGICVYVPSDVCPMLAVMYTCMYTDTHTRTHTRTHIPSDEDDDADQDYHDNQHHYDHSNEDSWCVRNSLRRRFQGDHSYNTTQDNGLPIATIRHSESPPWRSHVHKSTMVQPCAIIVFIISLYDIYNPILDSHLHSSTSPHTPAHKHSVHLSCHVHRLQSYTSLTAHLLAHIRCCMCTTHRALHSCMSHCSSGENCQVHTDYCCGLHMSSYPIWGFWRPECCCLLTGWWCDACHWGLRSRLLSRWQWGVVDPTHDTWGGGLIPSQRHEQWTHWEGLREGIPTGSVALGDRKCNTVKQEVD